MRVDIENSWNELLRAEWNKPYFSELTSFVKGEYSRARIFPKGREIFAAFNNCPVDAVKVVIIGQDPYHGENQANGLCFSVNPGVQLPRSLVNIFKEISSDTGAPMAKDGDLRRWSRQGVLLLNSILTVRAHEPGSHRQRGWEEFTDAVIRELSTQRSGIVYILWGSYAIKKGAIINRAENLVLTSAHPSPLSASRGFFGNHHFTRANEYLINQGKAPIEW